MQRDTPNMRGLREGLGALGLGAVLVFSVGAFVGLWRIELGPPVAASPSQTSAATLDPTRIRVAFNDDGGDLAALADRLAPLIADAWRSATSGRSQLVPYSGDGVPDLLIVFADEDHLTLSGSHRLLAGGRVRLVEIYRTNLNDDFLVYTAVHEIAHALGCCKGPGTDEQHWIEPCDKAQEVMCATIALGTSDGRWPAPGHAQASRFSERELRQLGLR